MIRFSYKIIIFLSFCLWSSAAFGTGVNFNDTSNKAAPINNPSFTGNVGIGSLAPGQALDVQGTVRMTNLTMSGQTPISGYVLTASDSAGDTTWTSASAVSGWTISGNNVYETGSGNVGIGTTALQTALAVMNGNVGIGTWTAAGGSLIVKGGNVGIGSAWPGQLLDVQGNLRSVGGIINGNVGIGTMALQTALAVTNGNVGIGTWTAASQLSIIGGVSIGSAVYANTPAPSNGLLVSGNVGIGSIAPGQILDVQGTVRAANFTMSGQTPVSGYLLTASDSAGDTTWKSAVSVLGWTVSGNNVYETAGGNVGIGSTALQTALAVTNGNVGIGTWTAAGGSLIVKGGNVGIGSAWPGQLLDVQGTVRIFNGSIGIGTSLVSTSALTVMNGNVGIGTWVPGATLDVEGTLSKVFLGGNVGIGTTILGNAALTVMNGNVGIGTWLPAATLDINGSIQTDSTGNSYFNGNVGIGSSTPGKALDVSGAVRMTNLILASNPANGYILTASDSSGDTTWASAATITGWTVTGNDVFETFNGNVGIGTTITNGGASLTVMGDVGIGTWAPNGFLQIGATGQEGTVLDVYNGSNSFFGIYDTVSGLYYGISPELPSPPGTSTLGGYFAGLGIGGATNGGGNAIFGVLNSAQSGNGIGQAEFTVYDNNVVQTFHNVLDDGNGNVGIGTTTPQGALVVMNGNVGIDTSAPVGALQVFGNQYIGDPGGQNEYSLNFFEGPSGIAGDAPSIWADYNNLYLSNGDGQVVITNAGSGGTALTVQESNAPYERAFWWFDGTSGTGTGAHFTTNDGGAAGSMNFNLSDAGGVSNFNIQDSGNNKIFDVLSNGNVGIGTTNPLGALAVMNGNVGIGTFAPVATLEINGSLQVDEEYLYPSAAGVPQLFADNNANLYVPEALFDHTGSSGLSAYCLTATGAGQVAWGLCTGSVGIGTAQPSAPTFSVQYNDAGSFGGSPNFVFNGNNVGIGTILSKNMLDVTNNVSIGTIYAGHYAAPSNSLIVQGNIGIGTWIPHGALVVNGGNVGIGTLSTINSTFEVVGSGLTTPGSGLSVLAGNVGVGTWVPSGYVTIESPTYTSNQLLLNNGTTGPPLAYPALGGNPTLPAFVVNSSETGGSRPLWFGYTNGANWDSFFTVGACGQYNQMCIDEGSSGNIVTDILAFGTDLAIGGSNNVPGITNGADGNASDIYFGNAGNVYFPNGNVGIGTITPQGALVVTNGNVGIGVPIPGAALDVAGQVRTVNFTMSGQNPISGYVLTASDSAGDTTWLSAGSLSEWTVSGNNVYETNGGNVGIGTTMVTTSALSIMNGNVGIGTWAPVAQFNVTHTSAGTFGAGQTNNDVLVGIRDGSNNPSVTGLTLSSGGKGGASNLGSYFALMGINAYYDNVTDTIKEFSTTGGFTNSMAITMNADSSNQIGGSRMSFWTGASANPSERMVIAAAGNVGIGTINPQSFLSVAGGEAIGPAYSTITAGPGNEIVQGNIGIGTSFVTTSALTVMNGNVGIGTWAPGAALVVMGGNVGIGTNKANYNLQIGGCTSVHGTTSCVDVAELIPSSESVSAGDVVMLDPNASVTVKKAVNSSNKLLFGVVTTNPAIVIEGSSVGIINGKGFTQQPEKPAVALVGRVPVKVNLENGPINIGDMITSSSVPGIGTKAINPGRVIGMALEPLTDLGGKKYKSILTYINPHWWENAPFIDEEIDELKNRVAKLEKKVR